jgi:hypothetical protein
MSKKSIILLVVLFIIIFLIINVGIWYSLSRCHYDTNREIKGGDTYKVGDVEYKIPDKPLEGPPYILKEEFILKMRTCLIKVIAFLESEGIEHWLSCGTLLGFQLHKTFMPWDDDLDVQTHWKNREYLFSEEFANKAKLFGLEAIYLFGGSLNFATTESSVARLRVIGTTLPVCDIFFVKEMEDENGEKNGIIGKVDKWSNGGTVQTFARTEQWPAEIMFPIKKETIDGIEVYLPNQPQKVNKMQYSEKVYERLKARPLWFSHNYPFAFFPWAWRTKSTI